MLKNSEKEKPTKTKDKDDLKSNSKNLKETVDLKDFVKHIRPFEWYGP